MKNDTSPVATNNRLLLVGGKAIGKELLSKTNQTDFQ